MSSTEDSKASAGGDAKPPAIKTPTTPAAAANSSTASAANLPKVQSQLALIARPRRL